jgi:hypothetical protein
VVLQGKDKEMWRKKEEGKVEEVDEELKENLVECLGDKMTHWKKWEKMGFPGSQMENQILQKMVFQSSFEAVLAVMLLIGEVIQMEMKNLKHEKN